VSPDVPDVEGVPGLPKSPMFAEVSWEEEEETCRRVKQSRSAKM
jgi:hypothetical protein